MMRCFLLWLNDVKLKQHFKMKNISALHIISVFLFLIFTGCSVSKNPQRAEMKLLQKGVIKDDSSFVYQLPYEEGKSHLLVQGYFSRYTHKNRAALDFKMKKGTKVCAARAGVVVRLKEDGNKGGSKIKYRSFGNFVIIQHEDSSRTGYWHLQHNGVLVNVGDSVKQGQIIALSGNSGYTYFPHLHFIVWRSDKRGQWSQIGTRFKTNKGIRYLRPFRFYRNQQPTD
jgi:murein DD-endopeptidase MepM/ murein hydrolase activator NlpD